jgi:hypothetical protein
VHGANQQTRGEILRRCEAVAAEMQALLKDSAEGAIPIVVAIRVAPELNPNAQAVAPNISQLAHGGFHLQINVQVRPDLNFNDLRTELIRLMVVERILRDHKSITPKGRILPEWLLIGINEALDFRSRNKPSAVFSAVFRTGKVFGIEDILDVNLTNLDALSRTIFDTSCCALVFTLLEQPDGSLRFRKLLHALPVDERSHHDLINEWFPNLALSASSLDKWWSLQMANLARPNVFETMGPDETATALENALYFRYTNSDPAPRSSTRSTSPAKPKPPEPEAKLEETPQQPQDNSPSGIIRRLFRRSGDKEPEAKEEPKKVEPKPEPKPTPEPKTEKEAGPSLMRRLFGGDDKENKEDKKKEAPAEKENEKEKTALLLQESVLETVHPLLAFVDPSRFFPTDEGRLTVTIFGLGKKKTPEELAAEETAKAEKAAAKAKADEEKAKAKAAEKAKEAEEKAARDAERSKAREEKVAADAMEKADKDKPKADTKAEPERKKDEESKPATTSTPAVKPKPKPSTPSAVSIPFDEFAKIASRKDVKSICGNAANNLNALHARAHPLFRSVITGYVAVLGAIAEGKTKEVPQMLAELKLAREGALASAKAVQAHMDWYEAQHTKGMSGMFDDYLKLPETIKKELPPRNDIISQHLDEVEAGKLER